MTNKPNIEKKLEDTLNSLNGLQKAKASPYLLSSLLHQLKEDKGWWTVFAGTLSRPVVAISMSSVIILLHIWLLLSNADQVTDGNNDQLYDLAIAYHFDQNTLQDQNSPLP